MEYQKKIKRILASLDQNDQILKAVALRIDNEALQHARQFDEEHIFEKNKIDIKPSMIQPIKEIKSLGKFKVKVSLHSEIDAEIHIVVESAETIQ